MWIDRHSNQESGFSLMELLVSVAIVGVLVATAVPEFQSYKKKAYDALALSYMKNAVAALNVAANDIDTGERVLDAHTIRHIPTTPESLADYKSAFPGLLPPDDMKVYANLFHQTDIYDNVTGIRLSVSVGHCKGTSSYTFNSYFSSDQIYIENIECNGKVGCIYMGGDGIVHTKDGCT